VLNNVNLCGRLVKDPELKTTTNGTSVVSFTVAVDRDYTNGEERQTDFISVVAWKGTAEFISKYFSKGKMIIINGSIQTRKYTTQNGENRHVTEIIARNVYFAGDKTNSAENGNFANNQAMPDGFMPIPNGDDLPF